MPVVGCALVPLAALCLAAQQPSPEVWTQADAATHRLAPAEFSHLPRPVRAELDREAVGKFLSAAR
jgi:hypothetical protein